jgi:hypothetical protein
VVGTRWWTRFRGWPWWGQAATWLFLWPAPLALLALSRPAGERRSWTALAAFGLVAWIGAGVAGNEPASEEAELVAVGDIRLEPVERRGSPTSEQTETTPRPSTTDAPTTTAAPTTTVPPTTAPPATVPPTTAPPVTAPPTTPPPPPPPPTTVARAPASSGCHPAYGGCLDAGSSDYDCAGGSGNGPDYTGTVQVFGPDPYDLDRDGDGVGCEDG